MLIFLLGLSMVSAISSSNYNVTSYVISSGGNNVSSANYKTDFVIGDISGNVTSSLYKLFMGFWYGVGNRLPIVSSVILNSSSGNNLTSDNLTVYCESSDADGDTLTSIYNWYKDGESIAVLNMPFDTNVSNASVADSIKDYSSRANHGTGGAGDPSKTPTWNSSGKVGGAYEFDGVDDYISLSNEINVDGNATFSVWVYPKALTKTVSMFIGKIDDDNYVGIMSNGYLRIQDDSSTNKDWDNFGGTTGEWSHIAVKRNDTHWEAYKNGISLGTKTVTGANGHLLVDAIGQGYTNNDYVFNGTIDEVRIYNYSLSASQIWQNYIDSNSSHSSNRTIVSQETSNGDNWTVMVTPNDGTEDGEGVLSNELIIGNSLPTVTLLSPVDNNITTNRTPTFTWEGYDADGDSINYEINITTHPTGSEDNRHEESLSIESYTPSTDLTYLSDNNYWYSWKVRANDSSGYGEWSEERKINISALLTISLPVDSINFGSISYLSSNDTTDDSPPPLVIQNDGNCMANVSVNASQLWSTVGEASDKYKFKVANKSEEEGAFDWLSSLVSWTNMPITSAVVGISGFNYSDSVDSAEVDVYIEVPSNEPPATRSSIIIFTSSLDE